jgi:hypothetical protein
VYGPLLNGNTTILYEGKPVGTPDPGAFWRVISQHDVRVLFTAPTAFRAIKREDHAGDYLRQYDLSRFRTLFLAGERCDPDTLAWAERQLGVPVIDHWWQTETGWPIGANCAGLELLPVKPGSCGKPVPGYMEEEGVPADSTTETFVALKAEIDTWRWAGVPFYLRTGKRLQEKLSEIVITFEDVPHAIFESSGRSPNRLTIALQPRDAITLTVHAKSPGETMLLKPVDLSLDYAGSFKVRQLDAYERLLTDIIKGNLTLFMRRDELDAAWGWIDPIRRGWQQHDRAPKLYTAGSWGPATASALISRDGFEWSGEG